MIGRALDGTYAKHRAAFIYIARELQKKRERADLLRIFKIMYFAELHSIKEYNHIIFGDWKKFPKGPVPARLYNEVERMREGLGVKDFELADNGFVVESTYDPDMDELARAEIDCINRSIEENAHLDFDTLSEKSHKLAYDRAVKGRYMDNFDIAQEAGVHEDALKYIEERAHIAAFAEDDRICK